MFLFVCSGAGDHHVPAGGGAEGGGGPHDPADVRRVRVPEAAHRVEEGVRAADGGKVQGHAGGASRDQGEGVSVCLGKGGRASG